MSEWECGVCGYIHKGDDPPEKCPVCEAPGKMFIQKQVDTKDDIVEETSVGGQAEPANAEEPPVDKQWRCSVSGYLHTGPTPPEKCPVCDATADKFEEVVEVDEDPVQEVVEQKTENESNRRWRCTVCGYIHQGDEPPEKCPLCGADRSQFEEVDEEGNTLAKPSEDVIAEAAAGSVASETEQSISIFNRIASLSFRFHLHSIHTHFPNGILPIIVVFLGLAIYFNIVALETAAFFNSIAVLVALPVVMLTGYIEWQKRYKGIKSAIFITKILCSLIVLASVNILVFWHIIDPSVATEGSAFQLIYFAVAAVALGAAGIAGHLGGKLAFASRV